jgi:O-antigen/teichoic acid export membrane protein
VAGFLTYLYFAIASHELDRDEYGRVVVLWSINFVVFSVLYRPVEQLVARTVAEREAHGEEVRASLRVAAAIQASIAAGCVGIALVVREVLGADTTGDGTLYWLVVVAVVGYAANVFCRGYLAGSGRFRALSGLFVAEAVARLSFALAVAVGLGTGQTVVALGIAAGPYLSLLILPFALRSRSQPAAAPIERRNGDSALTLGKGSGFAAAVFLIMVSEQTLLSAGPLLVGAASGAAAAGYMFNVLLLARGPLLLFQGVAISLLPHITRLLARGREEAAAAVADSVRATVLAIAAFTVLVCAVVAVAGPAIMQLAFGDKFSYDRFGLLLVGFAVGPYLAATTFNQAALAHGQARKAAGRWLVCAVAFLVWNLAGPFDPARRVELGFAASAVLLSWLLHGVYREPPAPTEEAIVPGSPAELQLLATSEELV